MNGRIGFIEDDDTIRRHVARRLTHLGYQVTCFETADAAWGVFSHDPLDLYIVDRMVPGVLSGTGFCQQVRQLTVHTPLLILSALSDAGDRIEGLKSGADDYLTKPFEMEELCLRVESLLKRASRSAPKVPEDSAPALPVASRLTLADRVVDFDRFELEMDGKAVPLPSKECLLLKLLVERQGRVVTRDEILNELWDNELFPTARTVDNFIVRLRKWIEADPSRPKYIQSVRGMGYKFTGT